MKRGIKFSPLNPQWLVMNDLVTRFLYLSAGYGAGKTYCLVMKMFQLMTLNRGLPGGILAPSLKMFHRDVLPTIRQVCAQNAIEFRWTAALGELHFPATNSTVYVFHAQDDGVSIAGPNLAWFVVNEASLCSWNAVKAAFGRVRIKAAPAPQVFMCGTPEEFNWVYEKLIDNPIRDSRVIYAQTADNIHVGDWYTQMLLDSYDVSAQQQYVHGLYVPKQGNRFLHAFNRHWHCSELAQRVADAQVLVKVDFNVNPMAATLSSFTPWSPVKIRTFKEIKIAGANTYDLCNAIKDALGPTWKQAKLFPDPAGVKTTTNAQDMMSDIKILKKEGFLEENIHYKPQISVKDCYHAINNLFEKGAWAVHPSCKEFIADAEQVKVIDGAFKMDKTNLARTHWLDGAKNMADYLFPVVKSYSEVNERRIR